MDLDGSCLLCDFSSLWLDFSKFVSAGHRLTRVGCNPEWDKMKCFNRSHVSNSEISVFAGGLLR